MKIHTPITASNTNTTKIALYNKSPNILKVAKNNGTPMIVAAPISSPNKKRDTFLNVKNNLSLNKSTQSSPILEVSKL